MATTLATPPTTPDPPLDPGLVDACGDDPGSICEAVWDRTDNETLSKVADWFIGRPLAVVTILAVAWVLSRLARRTLRRWIARLAIADRDAAKALQKVGVPAKTSDILDPRREGRAESIAAVTTSSISVLIWAIAGMLVLGELGINLAPLLASAGIAGVALGFGAQSLVKDCITGLFMLIEDQYGIGDVVDLGEASGVVQRVTLRTTVLRGVDGTVWHVPNGEVMRVGNRSQQWSVAIVDTSIAADADVARARDVIEQTAQALCADEAYAGDVVEAPEMLGVESITRDAVTLRLVVKTRPGEHLRLQRALREAAKEALDAAGIPGPPLAGGMWGARPGDDPSTL